MANEKEEVLKANAGAPTALIPDLKKKDKERKKAGAAWGGARGAASEFSGATGGAGSGVARAAAGAAGAVGEGAAELAGSEAGGIFSGVARFFANIAESLGMGEFWAGLTASMAGRMAIAAAAFLMMAAAGILGYALLKGKASDSLGNPNLGGIADSMRVHAGGDDRMGVNSNGELRFDPLTAPKPAVAPAPTDAKAGDAKPAPDQKSDADTQQPVPSGQLAHNLSGAQLSSSLGGDFGNKNIFAGNSNAPKFGSGPSLTRYPGAKGQLSKGKASTLHATASARSVNKGSANKAFGQLRLAKGLSQQGASASTAEQAAASSQGAFDQQQPTGGALATSGAPGGDTPPSMGGGAPDTSIPNAPSDPTGGGTNQALQSALQQISDLANKAMSDMQTGMMEIAAGAVLIGIGIAMGGWWGVGFIVAGAALVLMGVMMVMQANKEKAQAMQMGQALASQIGNQQQGDAINYCTQQAVANGTPVSACNPPDNVTNATDQSAQDAADINTVHQIPVGTAKVTQ